MYMPSLLTLNEELLLLRVSGDDDDEERGSEGAREVRRNGRGRVLGCLGWVLCFLMDGLVSGVSMGCV